MRSRSYAHLSYLARRSLFGESSFEDICSDRQVICKEEEGERPPAIFLPSELNKIVSLHPETTQEAENSRIYGGKVRHFATVAYTINNVRLRDSGFYKGRWAQYFPSVPAPDSASRRLERISGRRALASSYSGVHYFGHWMRDDAATYLLAEQFGEIVSVRTPAWPDVPYYTDVFGQRWEPTDSANIEQLIIFRDLGQNSHRLMRYRELRKGFIKKCSRDTRSTLYIFVDPLADSTKEI